MIDLISQLISAANGSEFEEVDRIYKSILATDDPELIDKARNLLRVI